jgi:glyceraldehyde 3-phosphate dehydrogenase
MLSTTLCKSLTEDVIGTASAAIIEGRETRTHSGEVKVNLGRTCPLVTQGQPVAAMESLLLEIPVTQVVIYGWYDNELGSFSNILGETTVRIAKSLRA